MKTFNEEKCDDQPMVLDHEAVGSAYLTKAELAKRLRKCTRTIDSWLRRGYLPHIKIGRAVLFDWRTVQAHLAKNFTVHGV